MSSPQYLVRHDNGRIFAFTAALAARADMIQAMDLDEARALAAKRQPDTAEPAEDQAGTDFVISKASKDELEQFALENYGVDLDKRKKVDDLRAEVMALAEDTA